MTPDEVRSKIVEMVGDEKGSGEYPGSIRVTEMTIFRRLRKFNDSAADLENAFGWLVKHEYLSCEDRNRPHTRERIYVFLPKGKLAYDGIVESRERRLETLAAAVV
ncbi:hypothetical protein A2707_04705 [Candidatus Saccharibacteria bacterium RIFCSPHIGHO2_01_FULL_45_15]|nr:MAG: hypothetical protein A2707_04705 [Candidatus Saccharibacteria bacterium RIFCSPHIGHO2_01_FULL_45_15]